MYTRCKPRECLENNIKTGIFYQINFIERDHDIARLATKKRYFSKKIGITKKYTRELLAREIIHFRDSSYHRLSKISKTSKTSIDIKLYSTRQKT
jgi:hypothetical protein